MRLRYQLYPPTPGVIPGLGTFCEERALRFLSPGNQDKSFIPKEYIILLLMKVVSFKIKTIIWLHVLRTCVISPGSQALRKSNTPLGSEDFLSPGMTPNERMYYV